MNATAKARKLQRKRAAYEQFMRDRFDSKVEQRKSTGGYHRPGSWKNKS